jgi:FSR family fosmidomycin resistance protein-like MFS transporter
MDSLAQRARLRRIVPGRFVLLLLAIEATDEFVFGAREAAWPKIRDDLDLTYLQVGVLLSVPLLIGNVIEPLLGILGDVWRRAWLIVAGGMVFAIASVLVSLSQEYWHLLVALIAFSPASGAFVSLSQASLMDHAPKRRERNMALWTTAGFLGVLGGTAAVGGSIATGGGWRYTFAAGGAMAAIAVLASLRFMGKLAGAPSNVRTGIRSRMAASVAGVVSDLRRGRVVRWMLLLEFADLMLDVLLGYLALYLVDVVHASPVQAAAGVGIWMVAGLAGNLTLIPILTRVSGITVLLVTAPAAAGLFAVMLLVPDLWPKMLVIGGLGALASGWYPILQARLYEELPGRSGSAITLGNIAGTLGSLLPLSIGAAAAAWGLDRAMWLMLAGPAAIVVGLWRADRAPRPARRV